MYYKIRTFSTCMKQQIFKFEIKIVIALTFHEFCDVNAENISMLCFYLEQST